MNLPEHIAIIMDGNGRWARMRNMQRHEGHMEGSKTFVRLCDNVNRIGIKYLTVYALSTENLQRPQDEVNGIFDVINQTLISSVKIAEENNYKIVIIGDRRGLSEEILANIEKLENSTKDNTGLYIQVAIEYGGRDEIVRGVNRLLRDKCLSGSDTPIDEDTLAKYLDTSDLPSPELIIRTGGQYRLSNFLTWQSIYSELYFTEVLWPDFGHKELMKALRFYSSRDRKFGK